MVQRRHEEGQRPRISVSLDPDDYEWIKGFKGPSDSYTVSRIVHAARLADLKLEDATAGGVLEELAEWLKNKKRNKLAGKLHELLAEFLDAH